MRRLRLFVAHCKRQDPDGQQALREYRDFARWAGVSDELATECLRSATGGRRLTVAAIVRAGDSLAHLAAQRR